MVVQASDFINVKPAISLADILKRTRLHMLSGFFELVFKHKGYIAGGFPAHIARSLLSLNLPNSSDDIVYDLLHRYICNNNRLTEDFVASTKWWRSGKGDVDVWFPSEIELNSFMEAIQGEINGKHLAPARFSIIDCGPSPAGCAHEFVLNENIRIQVITKFLGPCKERMATFDICNAMVSIDFETMTIHKNWRQLEEKNMLHVSSWDSPWTINRVMKYLTRKNYKTVSPESVDGIYNSLIKGIEAAQLPGWSESVTKKRLFNSIDSDYLIKRFSRLFPSFTNEQLLFLSAITPTNTYDRAMPVLYKRLLPEFK